MFELKTPKLIAFCDRVLGVRGNWRAANFMRINTRIFSLLLYFLTLGLFFLYSAMTLSNSMAAARIVTKFSTRFERLKLDNIPNNHIESFIPGDRTTVDIMQLIPPNRLVQLSQKFKTALQKNSDREWLSTLIKNTPTGQPLPYDPRLGVSQTEYQEFLSLSTQLTMKKIGNSTLKVKREGTKFVFIGDDSLTNLSGIKLDRDRNLLETPYGATTEITEVVADPERQRLTGAWHGVTWKLERFDRHTDSQIKVQFSLGKLTQTGRGILHYEVTRISNRAVAKTTPLILQYDLPQSP